MQAKQQPCSRGEKEVKSATDCVVLLQVYSVGQERRAGREGSLAGGADAAAAGDHQPERKIGLLWSWMCVQASVKLAILKGIHSQETLNR